MPVWQDNKELKTNPKSSKIKKFGFTSGTIGNALPNISKQDVNNALFKIIQIISSEEHDQYPREAPDLVMWFLPHHFQVVSTIYNPKNHPVCIGTVISLRLLTARHKYRGKGFGHWTKIATDSIEYFTNSGLHPTNQKHLRPITKYMIDKYISP